MGSSPFTRTIFTGHIPETPAALKSLSDFAGKVPRPRRCSDEHWGISPKPLRLLRKRGFFNPSHFVTAFFFYGAYPRNPCALKGLSNFADAKSRPRAVR